MQDDKEGSQDGVLDNFDRRGGTIYARSWSLLERASYVYAGSQSNFIDREGKDCRTYESLPTDRPRRPGKN